MREMAFKGPRTLRDGKGRRDARMDSAARAAAAAECARTVPRADGRAEGCCMATSPDLLPVVEELKVNVDASSSR